MEAKAPLASLIVPINREERISRVNVSKADVRDGGSCCCFFFPGSFPWDGDGRDPVTPPLQLQCSLFFAEILRRTNTRNKPAGDVCEKNKYIGVRLMFKLYIV